MKIFSKNFAADLFQKAKKGTGANVSLILFLGLSIALLMTVNLDRIPQSIEAGSVAVKDIKADQNYEIIDKKTSDALRQEALYSVLPVYDFDHTIEAGAIARCRLAFGFARDFLKSNRIANPAKKYLSEETEVRLKKGFEEKLGVSVNEKYYQLIRSYRFHPAMETAVVFLLHSAMKTPIIHDKTELAAFMENGFVLRKLLPDQEAVEEVVRSEEGLPVSDMEEAVKKISVFSRRSIERQFNLEFLDRGAFQVLKDLAGLLVKANMNYNALETDARKQKAQANIKDVIIKVKRGESIIRSGDRFEPWHLTVIEGIRNERLKTNRFLKFVGTFLFVNLVLLIVYYYAAKYIRKFKPNRKDLIFLGLTLIFFLAVLRIGVFLGLTVRDALPFSTGPATLYYAIPIAAGAMLVRFILNSETALIFAVIISLFSGTFVENNLELTVYYLISGVFAAHVIAHVDKRSSVLLCGAYTGLVNALAVLSLNLLGLIYISGSVSVSQIALNMISGFFGGLFTSMVVLILTPVSEVTFNYTTDIKLLELANLSHPLLKQMIVRAPGTYHHSQIVGILSEAAAQAIGANPLLARVACYYHDIGKMKKPQYFIENQSGENPHDKLNPSMSALIIESHIKDGMDLALEYKLPKKIADMIPEHQGTKLMTYFYDKAKKMENPDDTGNVNERDYRYPGPKPQTREAGIIMLADTVEAAARALPEKTPSKIQGVVEKLLNHHFVDEQLDECDLTLKDLHKIAGAFVKILVGIYHQRVEYPEGPQTGEAPVIELKKVFPADDSTDQKRTSAGSNISLLFGKKHKKNPSSPGAA